MTERVSNPYFQVAAAGMRCEGVSLSSLARRHGTPLFVMSASALRGAAAELRNAFGGFNPLLCFAIKANPALAVVRLFAREGYGAEVVSGGELFVALRAGVSPSKIVFSGVGKTLAEMISGLKARVHMFNVESVEELRTLDGAARRLGVRAPVAIRVNPRVDAHTHRYITTGTSENKFGVDILHAPAVFKLASRLRNINLLGIHTHIGSQVTEPGPFVACARKTNGLVDALAHSGIRLTTRNMGGGLGISYVQEKPRMDAAALARSLAPLLRSGPPNLIMETGRYLVGEAGVLLVRVLRVKHGIRKAFAVTDGAMTELIRPALYEAHHDIVPVLARRGRVEKVDVVGPVCESSDFLGLDRRLPPLHEGDLLAVMGAGAYGSAMASNYNSRLRPAQVMVDGTRARIIRRRESMNDLVRGETS